MGKRKKSSRTPQGPKKRTPLDTHFTCLFCNHEESVSVKLDRKAGVGHLTCKVCGQTYQTNIHFLSEGVDVYSDWIDACDAVAGDPDEARQDRSRGPRRNTAGGPKSRAGPAQPNEDHYEDDFVVDDEAGMEGEYTGGAAADGDED